MPSLPRACPLIAKCFATSSEPIPAPGIRTLLLNPRDADALINVSNLLEAEGDFTASVTSMQKALGLAKEKTELYVMLGQKQDKAGQYPEAAESLRESVAP